MRTSLRAAVAALVAGAVALGLSSVAVAAAPAARFETESNDSTATANPLALGQTVRGSTSAARGSSDSDFYVLNVPSDGRVTLNLTFPNNLIGSVLRANVYYANGDWAQSFSLASTDFDGTKIAAEAFYMPAGRMYVEVYGSSSNATWGKEYQLTVTSTPGLVETEQNASFETADPLDLGATVRGSSRNTTAGRWDKYSHDYDFYALNLPSDGRVTLNLTFPSNLIGSVHAVKVYYANGDLAQSFWPESTDFDGTRIAAEAFYMPAGRMYVSVHAMSYDAIWGKEYQLTVTSTPGLVETEPNSSFETADRLDLGATVRGSARSTDDVDYDTFVLDTPTAGPIQLDLRFPSGLLSSAYVVSVYDAHGSILASYDIDASSFDGAWLRAQPVIVPQGRLYVQVYGRYSYGTWSKEYSLTVNRLVASSMPVVSGSGKVGATLSAAPGAWTAGATLTYQWFRSGRPIAGATGWKYKVTKADAGRVLTVGVSGSLDGHVGATRFSPVKKIARVASKVSASKPSVRRSARATVKVVVRTPATSRPTGTVTVKVAGRTVKVKVTAKSAGKVSVRLPKITKRGTYKAKVTFSPSGATKVSTKARTVTTTVRVR